MFIDSHCHLYLNEFADDMEDVIQRAEKQGITKFYLPSIDGDTENGLLDLERRYPGKCIAMMGLHPTSVHADFQARLEKVRNWLEKRRFAAVGEIGLDYYWDVTFKSQQIEAFRRQIGWALEFDLPIVIHSRNAIDDCINMVESHRKGALRGIFHCFSGSTEQAKRIIDLGFYLGIGGVLTYKNSGLAEVVSGIPLEHLVLETDAPYLAPVPFRGKRNESSYMQYVIEKLSAIKNVSIDEIAVVTTGNCKKVFGE